MMGQSGDVFRTGEFKNTLDEKGRIIFPSKLRLAYPQSALVVTQGTENCLWLFTEEDWQSFSAKITESTSPFNADNMHVIRKLIGPAKKIEFDKSDRLSIPQSLREYAELTRDCVILGLPKFIELWDEAQYKKYWESNGPSFKAATESLNGIHL